MWYFASEAHFGGLSVRGNKSNNCKLFCLRFHNFAKFSSNFAKISLKSQNFAKHEIKILTKISQFHEIRNKNLAKSCAILQKN